MFCETVLSVSLLLGIPAKKPIFELVPEPIFTMTEPR